MFSFLLVGMSVASSVVFKVNETLVNGNIITTITQLNATGPLKNVETLGYGQPIILIYNSSLNITNNALVSKGSPSSVLALAPSFPTISNTVNLQGCGAGSTQVYTNKSIVFTATAPPCLDYSNTIVLNPVSNSFSYSNSLYGLNIIVNTGGFMLNQNITLGFTSSYVDTFINLTINPPKLSALNYYNHTINLSYGQNFTDQQLLLQITAPKEPKFNKNMKIIPSWYNYTYLNYNGVNLTINITKIRPLNITAKVMPGVAWVSNVYGINITADNITEVVFNSIQLNAIYANSPAIRSCKDTFKENGTYICLDNISEIVVGDALATHNVSGGVTKAFKDYSAQANANYTACETSLNTSNRNYELQGDPNNPNSNLSVCRVQLNNSTSFSTTISNLGADGILLMCVFVLLFLWGRSKGKENQKAWRIPTND